MTQISVGLLLIFFAIGIVLLLGDFMSLFIRARWYYRLGPTVFTSHITEDIKLDLHADMLEQWLRTELGTHAMVFRAGADAFWLSVPMKLEHNLLQRRPTHVRLRTLLRQQTDGTWKIQTKLGLNSWAILVMGIGFWQWLMVVMVDRSAVLSITLASALALALLIAAFQAADHEAAVRLHDAIAAKGLRYLED